MPSQKLGNDTPNSDTAEPSVSHTVPRRTAATTPSGTATASARTSAPPVSCSVGPRRSAISVGHRVAGLERAPEVAAQRGAGPRHVLQRQRAIEAEAAPDLRGGVGRELAADQHRLRPARGQAHEREEDHRDADQHEHGEAQPTQDVGAQARLHRLSRRAGSFRPRTSPGARASSRLTFMGSPPALTTSSWRCSRRRTITTPWSLVARCSSECKLIGALADLRLPVAGGARAAPSRRHVAPSACGWWPHRRRCGRNTPLSRTRPAV